MGLEGWIHLLPRRLHGKIFRSSSWICGKSRFHISLLMINSILKLPTLVQSFEKKEFDLISIKIVCCVVSILVLLNEVIIPEVSIERTTSKLHEEAENTDHRTTLKIVEVPI